MLVSHGIFTEKKLNIILNSKIFYLTGWMKQLNPNHHHCHLLHCLPIVLFLQLELFRISVKTRCFFDDFEFRLFNSFCFFECNSFSDLFFLRVSCGKNFKLKKMTKSRSPPPPEELLLL